MPAHADPKARDTPIKLTFRVPSDTETALMIRMHRRGRPMVVQTIIARYLKLVAQEIATLPLSDFDIEVCYHTLSDLHLGLPMIDHLAGLVMGSPWALENLHEGYAEQLTRKLTGLTPGQRLALADGIECARSLTYEPRSDDLHTRLKKIGFNV